MKKKNKTYDAMHELIKVFNDMVETREKIRRRSDKDPDIIFR